MRAGALATLALVASVAVALSVGQPVSLTAALSDPASLDRAILVSARLPRIALGLLAGAGLSITGAAFQGLLRNPLAEPYVLGVAGGAALGATLALAVGTTSASLFAAVMGASATAAAATLFGLLATALVYAIARGARRDRAPSSTDILLAGVVVNAIATGAITFAKTLVRAGTAQQLLYWLAGFLDVSTPATLGVVGVAVASGSIVLMSTAPSLGLLALGEEHAAHLGVDVARLERKVFVASSLIVGAIVATCGIIGFLGLLVPHVVRRLVGPDPRRTLPLSLILGAATLVACDALARASFRVLGSEPPVGAITALLGGPLFLVLLTRRRAH